MLDLCEEMGMFASDKQNIFQHLHFNQQFALIKIILFSVFSYLVGCICFGYYLTLFLVGINLKEIGSKSLGATNVSRVLGKKGFAITFILDFLKGLSIIILAKYIHFRDLQVFIFSLMVVIGHIWPIQLKFSGGKGISTFLGVIIAINFYLIFPVILLTALLYTIVKDFSVSGIIAILVLPFALMYFHYSYPCVLIISLEILIIAVAHRKNILEFVHK